jgi:hypothetical protein
VIKTTKFVDHEILQKIEKMMKENPNITGYSGVLIRDSLMIYLKDEKGEVGLPKEIDGIPIAFLVVGSPHYL